MSELFKLKNGTVLVSTEAPGGIYNSAQLKKIADLCSKELAIVKATEDQRLALFVKESELDHVVSELKATGLGFRNYQEGVHQPVSCLGELCESHEQPALTTAMDLTKLIAHINLSSSLKIGINGCARCCTPCHTLDISVVGESGGYRVSLGGKTSQFPELASFFAEAVPAKELPRLLASIVQLYKDKAEPGESLNEVLDRCGSDEFVTALAPYSQDAAHRDDPFAVQDEPESSDSEEAADDLSIDDLPSEETIPDASFEAEDEILMSDESEGEDSTLEEPSFDFSHDDDSGEVIAEISISDDDDSALSEDILVNGGEEPALEDDEEMVFQEESLEDSEETELEIDADVDSEGSLELASSEPELIEDESVEIEADVPEIDTSLLDEGEDEGAAMDGEAERLFEEKLQASIEEDKLLRAADDVDDNVNARADALRMLESASDIEGHDEKMILSEEDEAMLALGGDEEEIEDDLEMIEDHASELEVESAREAAPVAPAKAVSSIIPSEDYDLEGFDLIDHSLRVSFGSGAYIDFDLRAVSIGKTRVFRASGAKIQVIHEEGGYSVEGGGMKMFFPLTALKAAS